MITRRTIDEEGNVVIRQYTKRESAFSIKIPYRRIPTFILGALFGLYGYFASLDRQGTISDQLSGSIIGNAIIDYFEQLQGVTAIFLAGTVAVGLGYFFGWAFITRGFRINRWPAAARQLLAIVAIVLLFTAVFSAVLNEVGLVRNQEDPDFVDDNFDLEGLTAPFYSELLNGLMDLIGNIPDPQELVATIIPGLDDPSDFFDSQEDTYLWRWLVAEYYNQEEYDFEKGFEEYETEFLDIDISSIDDGSLSVNQVNTAETRSFRMSQQYLSLGTSYSGEALTPWNSIYGSVVDVDNADVNLLEGFEGGIVPGSTDLTKNINEQPLVKATFDQPRTQGYIEYDTYWIDEFKDLISQNAVTYSEFQTAMQSGDYDDEIANDVRHSLRFGNLANAGTLSYIWGLNSLGGDTYFDNNPSFEAAYQNFESIFDDNADDISVYDAILQISNTVQNEVIELFSDNINNFDPTNPEANLNSAPDGIDKADYFWQQVAVDGSFGIKDVIAGFNNMLRAFDVPARPVVGFSVGNVDPTEIELRFEHVHIWIEALIPWLDDQNNLQFSWGTFNPIPDFNRFFSSQQFVYGRNALGGLPNITLAIESNDIRTIPSGDALVGDQDSYVLAQQNQAVTGGAQILYEGNPAVGQSVTIRLFNENDINSFVQGSFTSLGTELGIVRTDSNGWANFSLFVDESGTATFTPAGGNSSQLADPIDRLSLFSSAGSRNIYALVAQFGPSYDFDLIAWTLNGSLQMSFTSIQSYGISGVTQVFGGAPAQSVYAVPGETLDLEVQYLDNLGNPIEGEDGIFLYVTESTNIVNFQTQLLNLVLDPESSSDGQFGTTNAQGIATASLVLDMFPPGTVGYYAIIAFAAGTTIFTEAIMHVTNNLTLTVDMDPSDRVVYFDDRPKSWTFNVTAEIFSQTIANINGSTVPRDAVGIQYDVYMVEKDAFEARSNNNATMVSFLEGSSCTTDLNDINALCFLLTAVGVENFGIVDGDVTTAGITSLNLAISAGVIPLDSYYFIIYASGYEPVPGTYALASTIRMGFSPLNSSSFNQGISFLVDDYSFEEIDNTNVSIGIETSVLLLFLTMFMKNMVGSYRKEGHK